MKYRCENIRINDIVNLLTQTRQHAGAIEDDKMYQSKTCTLILESECLQSDTVYSMRAFLAKLKI